MLPLPNCNCIPTQTAEAFPLACWPARRHLSLLRYEGETLSQAAYEPTEPSTKNSSFLKSKPKGAKTDKHIPEHNEVSLKKMKDFLSNTNGEMVGHRKVEQSESESSQVIEAPRTAKSTEKHAKKKKLIKTQQMPPKSRSSV